MNSRRLYRFVRSLGWKVERVDMIKRFDNAESTTNGGVIYRGRRMFISTKLRGRKLVLVLLHEAGHALAHERGFRGWGDNTRSEIRAYLYGWVIARKLGVRLKKTVWRKFNWEAVT